MRRTMLSLVLLLFFVLAGLGFYVYLSVTVARDEAASVTIADPVAVAAAEPITVGVILTGETTRFGWGDLAFVGDYAELTLAGQRVIVYENFNPTARPGVTLDQVIGAMSEAYAPRIYFLSVARLTPDEIKVDEKYASTIFIMNLATRGDVETLLSVLPLVTADIYHQIESDVAVVPEGESAQGGESAPPIPRETDAGSSIPVVLIVMLLALVLVGGVFGRWWKRFDPVGAGFPAKDTKKKTKRHLSASVHAKGLAIEEAARAHATDFAALGEPAPVIHKLSTYVLGDDHFDDSFPVELPDNTFLGECGLSITAPVNRYDTGKITAFEAWLFDQNDTRTISAGLLSEHAAHDQTLRQQLQQTTQLIEAKPGVAIQLETAALRIRVCVLDQQYGFSDTLPQRSFFDHIVVELAVWQK